jgi:hypothetical protein
MHRRAGTHSEIHQKSIGPGSAAHRFTLRCARDTKAFSSEVGTGSREENASNKNESPGFDSIKAGKARGGFFPLDILSNI